MYLDGEVTPSKLTILEQYMKITGYVKDANAEDRKIIGAIWSFMGVGTFWDMIDEWAIQPRGVVMGWIDVTGKDAVSFETIESISFVKKVRATGEPQRLGEGS